MPPLNIHKCLYFKYLRMHEWSCLELFIFYLDDDLCWCMWAEREIRRFLVLGHVILSNIMDLAYRWHGSVLFEECRCMEVTLGNCGISSQCYGTASRPSPVSELIFSYMNSSKLHLTLKFYYIYIFSSFSHFQLKDTTSKLLCITRKHTGKKEVHIYTW